MTIAGVLGAIAALGAIAGLVKWGGQLTVWLFRKAPASRSQEIDEKIQAEKHDVQNGGRPKWD